MTSEHYDIIAIAEAYPPHEQLPTMLRGMLADRFRLVAHDEARQRPIYALVAARSDSRLGPDIQRSELDCDAIEGAAGDGRKIDSIERPLRN